MNTLFQRDFPPGSPRDNIARSLFRYLKELDHGEEEPSYSLLRVVDALVHRKELTGHERDVCEAASKFAGEAMFIGRPYVPWGALGRSLGAGTGSKGGYLTGMQIGSMADALRPHSLIIAAGANVLSDLVDGQALPSISTKGTVYWLAEGAAPPADSDPVVGQLSMTPRLVLGKLKVAIQLLRTSLADAFLKTSLTRDVGEAIDSAVINGAGGAEPLGLLRTPGITSVSGTSLAWATIAGMRQTVLENGGNEDELFFLAAPNVQKLLVARERATGSGFIWADGKIDGVRAVATRRVPDGTLILGAANQILIGSWGPGPQIDTSQSSGFNTAQVDIRATSRVDVLIAQPKAFAVATSIT